jgi:hypothetical protein
VSRALENMNKLCVRLSKLGISLTNADVVKYQERPFAYEFYHQLQLLKEREQIDFGKYYIHPEVNKKYQHYFEEGKIPDFIIHVPNSDENLAVIEFKLTNNPKIKEDLAKIVEFKTNTKLKYKYGIEIIIGDTNALKKPKRKINKLTKSGGTKINIIWFNTNTWKTSESKIRL